MNLLEPDVVAKQLHNLSTNILGTYFEDPEINEACGMEETELSLCCVNEDETVELVTERSTDVVEEVNGFMGRVKEQIDELQVL
jgi:hypothetical protein